MRSLLTGALLFFITFLAALALVWRGERAGACAHLALDEGVVRAARAWVLFAPDVCFGQSILSPSSLADTLAPRALSSLTILVPAMIIGTLAGAALAQWAAWRAGRPSARLAMALAVLGTALPACILAPLVIEVFAVKLALFGVLTDTWGRFCLCVLTLALIPAATVARNLRGELLRAQSDRSVRFAVARGYPPTTLLLRFVWPRAFAETLPSLARTFATMFGALCVTEAIFLFPGLGRLFLEAAHLRDGNVLAALALWSTAAFIVLGGVNTAHLQRRGLSRVF